MDEQQEHTLTSRINGRHTVDRVILELAGGHRVSVEVIGVKDGKVALGIDAPRMVQIERGELVAR